MRASIALNEEQGLKPPSFTTYYQRLTMKNELSG